jgi:hypothetical protein
VSLARLGRRQGTPGRIEDHALSVGQRGHAQQWAGPVRSRSFGAQGALHRFPPQARHVQQTGDLLFLHRPPVKAYQKGTLRHNARGEGWDGGIGFGKVHKPGQSFDITVETKSDQIAKVEFYDWSKKIGEATEAPFTLKHAGFRQPGIHVLIAVAAMRDGTRATSHPAGMVVEGDMCAN